MSKIGGKPVTIKEGVKVAIHQGTVRVEGPKGSLQFVLPKEIAAKLVEGRIEVSQSRKTEDRKIRALFGLTRAMIANMVEGVSLGFEKRLELSGVGYRAQVQGNDLVISVGFSHPVKIVPAEGIKFAVEENNIIVSGIDKTLVGNTAAVIRAIKPPEPYKGKGIKYKDERIRRKVGKAAKALGVK
ncbi:MAG: 50S ribosomal protein L6 [Candidatus Levybacteria bacterium]|nr:50S ribosomal protein L6 [Candidatus Levybacteria bacterium]